MKRAIVWLIGLGLSAALLAGCGAGSEAGQEVADATVGGQAAANLTPSPEVVDPAQADAESKAAGEVPSILGSTPEPGQQVGGWERETFWETWDVGYPDGWQVEESDGRVILTGAYGDEEYRVELAQPESVEGDDLRAWATADLAALQQTDAVLTEVSVTQVDALKASNLKRAEDGAQGGGGCPLVRVYGQDRNEAGTLQRLIITVAQVGGGECSSPNTERLADAVIAEARP